ncbi:sensor histidine kinase [Candidatus Viridilinea mediisalina]|uniref:histidine kinase n=1 Tax=Candidatus Viridilinea mediisalina TaxID=2024553 RepID=A0A2A6RK45_9CHLR|nr:ATP-binding protein [Candidatus Viridilinea mediisalina]PDW03249.1 hypothetical protein CJ255_09700 [Candidatus Viridilinea mediisalina]
MISAAATFSLPALLGLQAGSGHLMSLEQVRAFTALLVRHRPTDMEACCFVGGSINLEARPRDTIVVLADDFGGAPFLVMAGQQGACALLSSYEGSQCRVRLISDPELVDRAALVIAQLSDHNYQLSSLVEAESQRAFMARIAAAMAAELPLAADAYRALMPEDHFWPVLAGALQQADGLPAMLAKAEMRQMLRELGVSRLLVGLLDADHQLQTLAADGNAPQRMIIQQGVVASVIRRGRPGSANSAAASGIGGVVEWAGSDTLTIVPLLRDEQVFGLLLATGQRPISGPSLALMHGIGALIGLNLNGTTASAQRMPVPTNNIAVPQAPIVPSNGPRSPSPRSTVSAPSLTRELGMLVERLGDAVLLVDVQGRVTAYTPTLARMLSMGMDAHGQPLVASGGSCLAPLLAEALMGEQSGTQEVQLPTGAKASVSVTEFAQGLWAFVLHEESSTASLQEIQAAGGNLNEAERNESFLSNFSNIVRVPLRELRELITRVPTVGELNEQQSRLIGQVVKLNSELTMLVNDLLALGQIRLESSEYRVPLRLDLLIEAAVGTQYAEFGRRAQQVNLEIAPGLPRVYGSEEGLGRAVAAMIDNAIKYSPTGAQIRVAAYQEGNELVVMVQDNGVGMLPSELDQVFDPFFRSESSAHLGISGRGLGLTIAKAVIEQHNGRIWAESTHGQGSSFAFSLPCDTIAPPRG